MIVDFHKSFDKQYAKLTSKQKEQATVRIALFIDNLSDPTLNNHGLKGKYAGYRSINIAGDLRAIFIMTAPEHAEFVYIGSHSQLYK